MKINASTRLQAAALPKEILSLDHNKRKWLAYDCADQGIDLNSSSNKWKYVSSYAEAISLARKYRDNWIIICLFDQGREFTRRVIDHIDYGYATLKTRYIAYIPGYSESGRLSITVPSHIKYGTYDILGRSSAKSVIEKADTVLFCAGTDEEYERLRKLNKTRVDRKTGDNWIKRKNNKASYRDKSGYDTEHIQRHLKNNPDDFLKTPYPDHF